jgi:hypothetical protein
MVPCPDTAPPNPPAGLPTAGPAPRLRRRAELAPSRRAKGQARPRRRSASFLRTSSTASFAGIPISGAMPSRMAMFDDRVRYRCQICAARSACPEASSASPRAGRTPSSCAAREFPCGASQRMTSTPSAPAPTQSLAMTVRYRSSANALCIAFGSGGFCSASSPELIREPSGLRLPWAFRVVADRESEGASLWIQMRFWPLGGDVG